MTDELFSNVINLAVAGNRPTSVKAPKLRPPITLDVVTVALDGGKAAN